MAGLRIYSRNLPHWRKDGRTYFVTWRLRRGLPELAPEERDIVSNAIERFHGERYRIHAYVVMNDHVHVLMTPDSYRVLEEIVGSWKSFTTRSLWKQSGRPGEVWQSEYFDRIVRDDLEFSEKQSYIRGNPGKRWQGIDGYRWVKLEAEL